MARKKKKRVFKRRKRGNGSQVTSVLFAITVLFMASYTIREGYLNALSEDEEVVVFQGPKEEFIASLLPVSQKMYEEYGVRPSVAIAQAILESDWGKSELAADYNNLYGRKSSDSQHSVAMQTSEFTNGKWITIEDTFKIYENVEASIEDHASLMVNGTDWDPTLYHPVIVATTYQEAAKALGKAGYATDPTYPEKLIEIIESYQLYQFDTTS